MPDDSATRADAAGPPEPWTPRKAVAGGCISAGDRVGKPPYSEKLRRHVAGDRDMGHAEETILQDWAAKERAPGRWVAEPPEGRGC